MYAHRSVHVPETDAQWRQNTIRGADMRGCETANYPREVSACEGQELVGRGGGD